MKKYPVLFTYLEKVEGEGFLASVSLSGRALLIDQTEEGEGWWMEGVNPGGMAAGGGTQLEARVALRQAFTGVLFEIALDASNADAFEAELKRFFNDTNKAAETEWQAAVAEVRAGRVESPDLPKEPAESPRGVVVEVKEHFAPSGNVIEPPATIAA